METAVLPDYKFHTNLKNALSGGRMPNLYTDQALAFLADVLALPF
jgi:hypothetical protein